MCANTVEALSLEKILSKGEYRSVPRKLWHMITTDENPQGTKRIAVQSDPRSQSAMAHRGRCSRPRNDLQALSTRCPPQQSREQVCRAGLQTLPSKRPHSRWRVPIQHGCFLGHFRKKEKKNSEAQMIRSVYVGWQHCFCVINETILISIEKKTVRRWTYVATDTIPIIDINTWYSRFLQTLQERRDSLRNIIVKWPICVTATQRKRVMATALPGRGKYRPPIQHSRSHETLSLLVAHAFTYVCTIQSTFSFAGCQ